MRKLLNASLASLPCLFVLLTSTLPAQAASFDCAKANSKVERTICTDSELSKLDDQLNKTYQQAMEQSKDKQHEFKEQKRWLKEIRNICTDVDCLKSAYTSRISDLSPSTSTQDNSAISSGPKPECIAIMGNADSAYDVYQGAGSNYGTFAQNKKLGFGLTDQAIRIFDFQSNTKLATLCDGKIVAVWKPETYGKFPEYLAARIYDDHFQPVSEELRITDSNEQQWEHSVASLLTGGFVVTWKSFTNPRKESSPIKVFARIFDAAGKPVSKPILVSPDDEQNFHSIAYGLSSGGFAVAWNTQEGGRVRIFDADGTFKAKMATGSWPTQDALMSSSNEENNMILFLPDTAGRVYINKDHQARNPIVVARKLKLDGTSSTELRDINEVMNLPGYQAAMERLLRSMALVLERGLREHRQKDAMGFRFCDGTNFYFSDEWTGIISSYSKDSDLKKFVANYGEALTECPEWQNFHTRQNTAPTTDSARGAPAAAPARAK
jgi:uncharacterized protein